MGRISNAEKARRAAEQGEAHAVEQPAERQSVVPMVRAEPLHPGGPTTADVHPAEVDGWISAGWKVA